MTGAAGAYSHQHTMHRRCAGSSWKDKHEVCKLITPSIFIRWNSFLCQDVALGLLCPVVPKSQLSDMIFILKFRGKGSLPSWGGRWCVQPSAHNTPPLCVEELERQTWYLQVNNSINIYQMKLILWPGNSPGSSLPSLPEIFAVRHDFHTYLHEASGPAGYPFFLWR